MNQLIQVTYNSYLQIETRDIEDALKVKWEDVEDFSIDHPQMELSMKDGTTLFFQLPQLQRGNYPTSILTSSEED